MVAQMMSLSTELRRETAQREHRLYFIQYDTAPTHAPRSLYVHIYDPSAQTLAPAGPGRCCIQP